MNNSMRSLSDSSLRCTMADHESQLKEIKYLCIDPDCKAPQRIACMICKKKYHVKCKSNEILDKEELLAQIEEKLRVLQETSPLQQLRNLRKEMNTQFDRLEKKFLGLECPLNISLDNLHSKSFTKSDWDECFQLIEYRQPDELMGVQNLITHIKQLSVLITKLSQSNQSLVVQSDRLDQTQFKVSYENTLLEIGQTVFCIDPSPCGRYLACARGSSIDIYDLTQYKLHHTIPANQDTLSLLTYSPDGSMLASCSDNKIIIIQVPGYIKIRWTQSQQQHAKIISELAFSPDNKFIISGSHDLTIKFWNSKDLKLIDTILVQFSINSVKYSPCGQYFMYAGLSSEIYVRHINSKEIAFKLQGNQQGVSSVSYSLDGKYIVSGGNDSLIKIWNSQNGEQIGEDYCGHQDQVTSVAFSPDSKFIVSGSKDKIVNLWNINLGKQETILNAGDSIAKVTFSKDGRSIFTGSKDGILRITKLTISYQ